MAEKQGIESKENDEPTYGFDEDTVESHVARAIYKSSVDHAREKINKLDLQPERLRRVFKTAAQESDRSAAILIFALVEDIMVEAFQQNLVGEVKGGWQEITSGNGLLATANDRITLIQLLGWIQSTVYADLRLLKSIRNRFAHHAEIDGFRDKQITSWIESFSTTEKSLLKLLPDLGVANIRQRFLVRSSMTVTRLVANLAVAPEARAAGVAPGHVEGRKWEENLENLKELYRIAAEVVLSIDLKPML